MIHHHTPPAIVCPSVTITDGDTIRCGKIRVRLSGIDAPELPGHCRPGRICAPGDPVASKASLAGFLATGPASMQPIKKDLYGRTVAIVRVGGIDASCYQLQHGQAIYKATWDTGRKVAKDCPQ